MSKNNKNNQSKQSKETKAENYYELKTDAVNRLVNADSASKAPIKGDPGKEFRSKGFLDKIPSWAKSLFIKFWFNGAVCYFVMWGLGLIITDYIDLLVVFGIILGLVTDILVNNVLRFVETYPGQNNQWMMFTKKSNWTIFANIPYAMLILFCVFYLYNLFNRLILGIDGVESIVGVEPLAFGFLYMAVDMFFVSIKNMILSIVQDAMEQNKK